MPEGHTLHRLARLHQRRYAAAPVAVSSPQGRFAAAASAVDGRILQRATAWGKHLFHHYVGGSTVHVHLGLYGTFTEWPRPPDARCRLRSGRCGCGWSVPNTAPTCAALRCARLIDDAQVADVVSRLGPDPLRRDADPAWPWARITKSRRPIGALLMDQTVIAGVGNVYRNELLFRHGIDPYRPGRAIGDAEFDAAWKDLVDLMKLGLRSGKIIAVRPEHDYGAPSYGPGRPRTYVYRRAGEPCRVCATTIRTNELEGRNVFWCPTCQM